MTQTIATACPAHHHPSGRCAHAGVGIDIHSHYYAPGYLALLEAAGDVGGLRYERRPAGPVVQVGPLFAGPIQAEFIDLDARIAAMDRQGVAIQALSLSQPMVYWAPDELSQRLTEAFNDGLIAAHQAHPSRLFGLATLPMQTPALALAELDRIGRQPAIRGIYMATCILGRELSDPAFFPVYERIEDLGLPIFLHPLAVVGMEDRLTRYFLANLLGNPFDCAIAASHLIFGGVMDRFPRLDIVLPHGGGALPYLLGRIEHGWSVRPECRHLPRSPRQYLGRFHFDTITHSPEALAYLIDLVGPERVVLGSDYCFDMGYTQPVAVVTGHPGLSEAARRRILAGNAASLLQLTAAEQSIVPAK